jgi:hypothetical protein
MRSGRVDAKPGRSAEPRPAKCALAIPRRSRSSARQVSTGRVSSGFLAVAMAVPPWFSPARCWCGTDSSHTRSRLIVSSNCTHRARAPPSFGTAQTGLHANDIAQCISLRARTGRRQFADRALWAPVRRNGAGSNSRLNHFGAFLRVESGVSRNKEVPNGSRRQRRQDA